MSFTGGVRSRDPNWVVVALRVLETSEPGAHEQLVHPQEKVLGEVVGELAGGAGGMGGVLTRSGRGTACTFQWGTSGSDLGGHRLHAGMGFSWGQDGI